MIKLPIKFKSIKTFNFLPVILNFDFCILTSKRGFIRFTKKTLVTLFTAWMIVVGTGLIYMFGPWTGSVEAVWYDDNWGYRQRVPIDTHTASETNVYNEISVDTATLTTDKLQADCDDLRFTKENGEILPYQIVSGCDSGTTVIRVGFDTMPIAPFNIYMYYGNPSASAGSSTLTHSACGNGCAEGTAASEEKAPSPVAYWKFDDGTGTNAQDSTVNNNDGTLTGGPTWQTEDQCITGKCIYFDGSDDYVSVGNVTALKITGPITINTWIRRNRTGAETVLSKWNGSPNTQKSYSIDISSNNRIQFFVTSGGVTNVSTLDAGTQITDQNWHLVTGQYDGSFLRVYVDGVEQTAAVVAYSSGIFNSTGNFLVGTTDNQNVFFKGFIDEPKVYNYARSAAQVKADYNARATGEGASAVLGAQSTAALNNGLVGYWKMDESSGNRVDSSGNSNSLTDNNTVTSSTGKFGNAGQFTAANSEYLSITDNASLSTGNIDFSISGWIYLDTKTARRPIVTKWIGTTNQREYFLEYNNTDDKFVFYVSSNGTTNTSQKATTFGSPSTATWYFVMAWHDSVADTINIQINNGTVDSTSYSSGVFDSTTTFQLGGNTDGNIFMDGRIDELRVYKRVLSAAERTQLYNFAPGPVGYWNMEEESGNVSDKSGNGNTGTVTGTTSVNGKYGKGRSFDGSDDYVDIGSKTALQITGDVSFGSWVYINAAVNNGGIITTGAASSETQANNANYLTKLNTSSGNDIMYIHEYSAGSNEETTFDSNLSTGTWYHIFIVRDSAAKTVKLYVNGVQTGSTFTFTNNSDGGTTNNFNIGREINGTVYFNGSIDDVKIYNYARTQKQVVEDMNAGHASVGGKSPVGYWKFDEGVDNTCSGGSNDACNSGSGGSSLDGANTNMASPATSTSGWTQSGKVGRGLVFDGSNDYVSITDPSNGSLDPQANPFTISAWVNTSSTGKYVVGKAYGANADGDYGMFISAGGKAQCFAVGNSGTKDATRTSATSVNTGTWVHITCAYSLPSGIDVYVNGKPDNSGSITGGGLPTTMANSTRNFTIGTGEVDRVGAGSYALTGSIDEVKVYSYALTADEVKVDMNLGSSQVLGALSDNSTYAKQAANQEYCVPGDSTSCVAPVGRWDFEENTGVTAYDKSGNANNGTLTSGPTWSVGHKGRGGGLSFDGTDDNVTFATTITGVKTVGFWVYPSTTTQYFIDLDGGTHYISASSGTVSATGFTSPTIYVNGVSGGTITANTWNHIEVTTGTSFNTTTGMTFGKSSTNYLNGKLDQVRIYNYARSAAQVVWDYSRGAPIGHWRMDECQGTTINDSSGNGLTGTLSIGGSGTQTAAGTCNGSANTVWKDGVTGKINYSVDLDGTDDAVSVPSSSLFDFGANNFSLSIWIKTSAWSSVYRGIMSKYQNKAAFNLFHAGDGINKLVFFGWQTNNATGVFDVRVDTTTTAALADGNWHHIVAVRDGDTSAKIYVDGVVRSTANGTQNGGAIGFSALDTFNIGRYNNTANFFNGQLDDARVYNYALTATQIKEIRNQGTVNFKPLTGSP